MGAEEGVQHRPVWGSAHVRVKRWLGGGANNGDNVQGAGGAHGGADGALLPSAMKIRLTGGWPATAPTTVPTAALALAAMKGGLTEWWRRVVAVPAGAPVVTTAPIARSLEAAVVATVTTSSAKGVAMSKSWVDVNQARGGPERCNRVRSGSSHRCRTGSRPGCHYRTGSGLGHHCRARSGPGCKWARAEVDDTARGLSHGPAQTGELDPGQSPHWAGQLLGRTSNKEGGTRSYTTEWKRHP
jgi:hypothetical protein